LLSILIGLTTEYKLIAISSRKNKLSLLPFFGFWLNSNLHSILGYLPDSVLLSEKCPSDSINPDNQALDKIVSVLNPFFSRPPHACGGAEI